MTTGKHIVEAAFVAFLAAAAWGCTTAPVPLVNVTEHGEQWVWPFFLDGKPTVIAFWNTNEMECLRNVPALKALDAREGSVQLVTVATGRDRLEIEKWRRRERIRYAVLLDLDEKLAETLGVDLYPTFLYFDTQGREIARSYEIRSIHNWFDKEQWLVRSGAIPAPEKVR